MTNVPLNSRMEWKKNILRQLRNRDKNQHETFRDFIHFYSQLLEKTNLTKGLIRGCTVSPPPSSSSLSSLLQQKTQLKKTTGELAFQVLELQEKIKIKECFLEEQHARLQEAESACRGAFEARGDLQSQIAQVQSENASLKRQYDLVLAQQTERENRLREEKLQTDSLLERVMRPKKQAAASMNNRNQRKSREREEKLQTDSLLERVMRPKKQAAASMNNRNQRKSREKLQTDSLLERVMRPKKQAAASMNNRNQRKSRAQEASRQKEIQNAAKKKTETDSSSAPSSRCASPKNESQKEEKKEKRRLFRSASATSPRILSSIRELFEKRRGHSVCSMEEDQICPIRVCVSARVPTRARQVLEAHEQGINAVRFSSSSDLLATGGTDRVIKLWDITAGLLTHRASLEGSTGGITCIEFDATGSRLLAASYDKSALLWRVDDPTPKLTLTGHRRKVTSARFTSSFHQVVTGSADGSIRLWDLHRTACIQAVEVSSFCSDVVCSENWIISGHFDSKIRVWDQRALSCVQELPARGKITSLDISPDHRQLLSCCRDDCLQLVDLRRRSQNRLCYRADGFKCGSDSTKAVISPDGSFLCAGGSDGAVYIWNTSTDRLESRLADKHSSPISAVSWSLSGESVVSVDKSRLAVLWSQF